jgi:hypothetical protein
MMNEKYFVKEIKQILLKMKNIIYSIYMLQTYLYSVIYLYRLHPVVYITIYNLQYFISFTYYLLSNKGL